MTHPKPRYLTKSRFKLANECPAKLFYTAKKEVYADKSFDDDFLAALAEGGFQVGELAKAMYPSGHDIEDLDYETSLRKTAELLEQENVVIFEPAFLFEGLFVRVDVLVKEGNSVQLLEVKAKSCSGADESQFFNKRKPGIAGKWLPYVEDAIFQHHVLSGAHPEWDVRPYLMLINKEATSPTNGLHQKFLLQRDKKGYSKCIQTAPLNKAELESGVLVAVPLDHCLEVVRDQSNYGPGGAWDFHGWIAHLAKKYQKDERIWAAPTSNCGKCQFQASKEELSGGKRSGFHECWKKAFDLKDADFGKPTVLEVWLTQKKTTWLQEQRVFLEDLCAEDFDDPVNLGGAMESKERQWLQVHKSQQGDESPELRRELKDEMASWEYPLHFIDFETMSPAIPMHAGCRPYEVLAFQFSHHVVEEDGSLRHVGEYIEPTRGAFPNFDFVRALKKELENDNGTIFRYADHENTVLCGIRRQLKRQRHDHADAEELIAFIESITHPTGRDAGEWDAGPRDMVDLLAIVKKYYFDPRMKGSNSIKQVLPAVLNSSEFLQQKYQHPVDSLNFTDQVWLKHEYGEFVDPYHLLPTMFEGFSAKDRALLLSNDGEQEHGSSLNNGGAAMTAFARMQFTEMTEKEREHLRAMLLKYCELDTLAMVMIYEAWRDWLAPF
ncbi:MAG: DUF2779 domain-containing protein [Planctomycetes bacterium]|nr:DUF2779 domain-containing protein [Planctomycetota bacterium]MCP4771342.1 DUF2779 domain-containing protein [Planctomycetota bacterium]MCP4861779.1 DUF2779 domain-containing protein [Planctomycetota bacterium]